MATDKQIENLLATMVVVVDTREQRPFAFAKTGTLTTTATLKTGDYSVRGFEDHVAIERKEYGDFLASLSHHHKRFMAEMARLAQFRFRALVVETDYSSIARGDHPTSKVRPESAIGMIVKLTSMNIPVVTAWDRKGAEDFTLKFLKRAYVELRLVNG